MELEKPSLAGCLSRRTNWLCHTVFTLTTHCGGGCVATVGGSEWGVKVNARAVGSALQSPSRCTTSHLKEEERPDLSSQLSPLELLE